MADTPDNGMKALERKREDARRSRKAPTPRHPRPPEPEPAATPAKGSDKSKDRSAFTWRLTVDQKIRQTTLINRLCMDLGQGRLDKADVLEALVTLAETNRTVYNALVSKLSAH
ncbi:hypothetical protein [Nonomuraea ceibae]|uniref:hypothetical protein n=1 Tax=Nonomuraea ceibae TaxID=1935170 RepID=UPI001C604CCC|nr:hypothetical protein [Nonomuraea ceibae]